MDPFPETSPSAPTPAPAPAPAPPPAIIKPRDPKVAAQLSRCCPGLGHIYAGDIRRGLLFLAGADLPLIFGSLFLIAPWGSVQAAAALWIVTAAVCIWASRDARKTVLRTRSDYRMKDYNHWLAYLVIGVVPTLAAAMATAVAISTTLSRSLNAASDLPEIGIARGDGLVEWRAAYREHRPALGDRVIYRGPLGSKEVFIGQVIGLPGDTIATPQGSTVIPEGSLGMQRSSSTEGHFLLPETAVSGKLVYRYWPLNRLGSLAGGDRTEK